MVATVTSEGLLADSVFWSSCSVATVVVPGSTYPEEWMGEPDSTAVAGPTYPKG